MTVVFILPAECVCRSSTLQPVQPLLQALRLDGVAVTEKQQKKRKTSAGDNLPAAHINFLTTSWMFLSSLLLIRLPPGAEHVYIKRSGAAQRRND